MIPNENCYCEIDPNVVDQWGIPVLRFHWKWGDNEIKMAKDMQETFREIVEAAGGTTLTDARPTARIPTASPTAASSFTKSARCAWASTQDFGSERVLPGARREESIRHRWGAASSPTPTRIPR